MRRLSKIMEMCVLFPLGTGNVDERFERRISKQITLLTLKRRMFLQRESPQRHNDPLEVVCQVKEQK